MRNSFQRLHLILCAVTLCIFSACGGGSSSDDEEFVQEEAEMTAPSASAALRSCGREGGPLRIMPLGDSVTHSERGQNSYRRPLWFNLLAANCVVDFVGSRNGVSTGSRNGPQVPARNPDFDQDHEGYWDYRADEILGFIGSRVQTFSPDVVLIHLGTNDLFQGQSVLSTIDDLARIIDTIRMNRPDVAIVLAKLIPASRANDRISQLNAEIDALAASRFDPFAPLLVVDHSVNYFISDNFDGVHPGDSGEVKMADKWTNAILQIVAQSAQ